MSRSKFAFIGRDQVGGTHVRLVGLKEFCGIVLASTEGKALDACQRILPELA